MPGGPLGRRQGLIDEVDFATRMTLVQQLLSIVCPKVDTVAIWLSAARYPKMQYIEYIMIIC